MPRNLSDEDLVFFVDRALGAEDVPNALRAAGAKVEIHSDHFAAKEQTDEAWIESVAKNGWAILTKDKRIRRNALERAALERSGAATFILTAGDISGSAMAQSWVKALPRMRSILQKYDRPVLCTVSASGAVAVISGQRRGAVKRRS